MGCDIHSMAEVRKDGLWQPVSSIFPNPYKEGEMISDPVYYRNYDLFAMLADVRNGYGFAGIKTGEGFVPISEPKGIPEDATEEYKELIAGNIWGGDHSHSYLTVAELKAYDWDQITIKRGIISFEQFKECTETGVKPNSWSGDISGSSIIKIEEEQAEEFFKSGIPEELKNAKLFVNYHWSIQYREYVGGFLERTLPILESLGAPEDVRILFFFDN